MKHIISLGAGVQSSTLAMMAALGVVEPMPEAAIFADTGDEPQTVYRWLDWLEAQLPFHVHRVSVGAKLSDLATEVKLSGKSGNYYVRLGIPCFTTDASGNGIGMRQCTRTVKIEPIRRKMRELSGGIHHIIQWIGISRDEAHRMKPSRDKWCENRFPLIDMGMTRGDCLRWMQENGFPAPPRSACVYCPYHSDAEWLRLKTDEPAEFAAAVAFERRLQAAYSEANAFRSVPWLHSSRKPLATVNLNPDEMQPSLFGNECEGMCGV